MAPAADLGNSPRRRAVGWQTVMLVVVALALVSIAGLWLWPVGPVGRNDLAVKTQLEEMGALVVSDSSGIHVASVNLSTIKDTADVRRALALLPELGRITALDLSRTQIDDGDLETIGQLTTLASLALRSTSVTDNGLQQLAALTRLESLQLSNVRITSAGLPRLAPLQNLKVLDLSSTEVTSGLEPLAALPELRWLLLSKLTFDDDALVPLSGAPKLKRLTLIGSDYSQDAVDELQRRRSDISIDR